MACRGRPRSRASAWQTRGRLSGRTRGRAQVYSTRQARSDIDSVYSMGLFDDVNILPQPAEDSTLEHPKACTCPFCR